MGGRFTVASGRPPESVRAALGDIRLSLPAICCNGSLLYDFSAERVLRHATLERGQATAAILEIMEKFPRVGVEVMAGAGDMYVVRANPYTHAHQVDEQLSGVACPLDAVPDGWVKVVFAGDPEMIRKVGQYAKTRYYGRENYFLATNSIYYEIMPAGVGKASALRDLCALLGVPVENTVVIGDYYNDLEIMQAAGYSVAVSNAPPEVKAAGRRSDQLHLFGRRRRRISLQTHRGSHRAVSGGAKGGGPHAGERAFTPEQRGCCTPI